MVTLIVRKLYSIKNPISGGADLNVTRLHVHASKYSKKVKWIHDFEFSIQFCYTCINIQFTLVNWTQLAQVLYVYGSQDRVVCILTRLWTGMSRVWFLMRARDVFLQNIQTSCGFHLASCSMPSGSKVAGAWCWPLPSTAKVRTEWSCTSGPQCMPLWCGQGQLHLYLWCSLFY